MHNASALFAAVALCALGVGCAPAIEPSPEPSPSPGAAVDEYDFTEEQLATARERLLDHYIVDTYDEFTDVRRISLRPVRLPTGRQVTFTIGSSQRGSAGWRCCSLSFAYRASEWLFLDEVIFLINDVRHSLSRPQIERRVVQRGVYEFLTYSVTPDFVHQLAYANEVRLRLSGSHGRIDTEFTVQTFELLTGYFERHLAQFLE